MLVRLILFGIVGAYTIQIADSCEPRGAEHDDPRSDAREGELDLLERGMGIAKEDEARIFERFERAASSKHYGGLGLGLWVVRRIVESMGGTIFVTSELGKDPRSSCSGRG